MHHTEPPSHRYRRRSHLLLIAVATSIVLLFAPGTASADQELRSCKTVVITPNSGDGLFSIRVRGIGCKPARRLLLAWGRNGYQPSTGPTGYHCTARTLIGGNSRMTCRRIGRRLPMIAFTTGL